MPHPSIDAPSETIQSRQNSRLKELRKRFLRDGPANDGLIAVEGWKLLEEAVRSGLRVHSIFVREDMEQFLRQEMAAQHPNSRFPAPAQFVVAADAFNHACATDTPQGVAAIVEMANWPLEALLAVENPLLLIFAELQDPGNAGTIIRTAEAMGASGILLTPGTVSPWKQKLLRASAGSSFRLPVVPLKNIRMLDRLPGAGIALHACTSGSGTSIHEVDLRGPVALVIGNEGAGISAEVLSLCSGTLHIPCPGPVESLNAAVAASILLYEASRQRAPMSTKYRP